MFRLSLIILHPDICLQAPNLAGTQKSFTFESTDHPDKNIKMTMRSLFPKYRYMLLYGISLALLLFLLRWLELRFIIFDHAIEVYIGAIAVIFTALGIWLALILTKPKIETVVVEKKIYIEKVREFIFNQAEMTRHGISKRELEVLQLMAEGLSNAEIAARLFISLNTIKTHASNLFIKLDASRRTQAIEKAKTLSLIP